MHNLLSFNSGSWDGITHCKVPSVRMALELWLHFGTNIVKYRHQFILAAFSPITFPNGFLLILIPIQTCWKHYTQNRTVLKGRLAASSRPAVTKRELQSTLQYANYIPIFQVPGVEQLGPFKKVAISAHILQESELEGRWGRRARSTRVLLTLSITYFCWLNLVATKSFPLLDWFSRTILSTFHL